MAVLYSIYRDNRKTGNHRYYARTVMLNTVNTAMLADRIQANCSLKHSDVIAVIKELVEVMKIELQNSNAVKLDGFGIFKVGIKTCGAEEVEDFTVNDNITGMKVNFLPTGHKIGANGKFTRDFLDGAKLKRYNDKNSD